MSVIAYYGIKINSIEQKFRGTCEMKIMYRLQNAHVAIS